MARVRDAVQKPAVNSKGVLHLHISGEQPEAGEVKKHVEGMRSRNATRTTEPVFNPAVSEKQQKLMAVAEHSPEMVHKKNRGVLSMSKSQLHDFAKTRKRA